MQAVLIINGQDFTDFLLAGAIGWSRNDLDSADTGRTLDGIMHRTRIAMKRKLAFTCRELTTDEIMRLNEALSPTFVQVTYLDPMSGVITKTFYGSTVESTVQMSYDGETYWTGTTFNLIEQ